MSQNHHPHSPTPILAAANTTATASQNSPPHPPTPTLAATNTTTTTSQSQPAVVSAPVQATAPVASGAPHNGPTAGLGPPSPNNNYGSTSPSTVNTPVTSQTPQTTTPISSVDSAGTSSAAPVNNAPQSLNTHNQQPGNKSIISKLWALKTLLYALIIIAITDGLVLTASSPSSPLGSIGYSKGVLILSILSMLTTYSLVVAAKTAWDRVRFLLLSKEGNNGQNLLVFWTLSAEIGASCLILWREFRQLLGFGNKIRPAGTPPASRRYLKSWSIMRIISWAVMQFPGVIIMTIINSTTSYVHVQWIATSGGVGVYDSTLAFPGYDPIRVTNYALNILQDTRNAIKVPPVNTDCINAKDSCTAYLLPGGLSAINPFPNRDVTDTSIDAYMTKGEPVYQLDFWKPPKNYTFPADACSIYASEENSGFQLCASSYAGDSSQLIAGWTPCIGTILPSGECDQYNQTGSWGAYIHFSTRISISRRTATITMLRDTGEIVAWSDLGNPKVQHITASEFKSAFDVMLLPWSNSSSSISSHDFLWLLTTQLAGVLSFALTGGPTSAPYDPLYNLFATALYVFNPVNRDGAPYPVDVEPGLPHENYFNGSYAKTRIHAVPQRWTVWTYVAVSGFLLLAILIAVAATVRSKGLEASEFPFVDLLNLRWIVRNAQPGNAQVEYRQVDNIREVFTDGDFTRDEKILEKAGTVMVIQAGLNSRANNS